MPSFSQFSRDNLATCEISLRILFTEVIRDFDCRILEGHRSLEEQARMYAQGRTTPGAIITNVDGVDKKGAHNYHPSRAVDVMAYPVDWSDRDRHLVFAGWVLGIASRMRIPVRWGGDWNRNTILTDQTFNDWAHWELV